MFNNKAVCLINTHKEHMTKRTDAQAQGEQEEHGLGKEPDPKVPKVSVVRVHTGFWPPGELH
jgi:hypothetical protein